MTSNPAGGVVCLSVEELERIAKDLKEDYQREANQGMRKKDWEQGIGALASMECVDTFLYNCRLRAGIFSPATPNAAAHTKRKKKVEPVSINRLNKAGGVK